MAPSARELLKGKPLGTDVKVSFPAGTLPPPYEKDISGTLFQTTVTEEFRLTVSLTTKNKNIIPAGQFSFPVNPQADIFTLKEERS